MDVELGQTLSPGQIIGRVQETSLIEHRILVPPNMNGGVVVEAKENGSYNINEVLVELKDGKGHCYEVKMYQEWPVRQPPRPVRERKMLTKPLITGQRYSTYFSQ